MSLKGFQQPFLYSLLLRLMIKYSMSAVMLFQFLKSISLVPSNRKCYGDCKGEKKIITKAAAADAAAVRAHTRTSTLGRSRLATGSSRGNSLFLQSFINLSPKRTPSKVTLTLLEFNLLSFMCQSPQGQIWSGQIRNQVVPPIHCFLRLGLAIVCAELEEIFHLSKVHSPPLVSHVTVTGKKAQGLQYYIVYSFLLYFIH